MFQFSIYGDRVAKLIRRRVVSANLLELAPQALQGIVVSNRLIFIRMWQACCHRDFARCFVPGAI